MNYYWAVKNKTSDMQNNMDKSEWNMPDIKTFTLYDFSYIELT